MYKTKVSALTAALVNLMLYGGIIACIAVPFATRLYGFSGKMYIVHTVAIVLAGVASVYIMYQLKKMFKTVTNGDPFVSENADAMKRIAAASFIIGAIHIVKAFFTPTPATFMIIIIFVTAGLFCLTLKQIFEAAVRFKEENSLTI